MIKKKNKPAIFKNKPITKLIYALCAAFIFTLTAALGLLYVPDNYVSDAFYQHTSVTDNEIVVVGIDERALEELGPLPWDRSIMGDVIFYLNSQDAAPAVIGVDVIYQGSSPSEGSDHYLAEAAKKGNVVMAASATFSSTLTQTGESFYIDDMTVSAYDRPYEELGQNATVGHVNVMPDKDGVIRHALTEVEDPKGSVENSFSRVIYEKYCEAKGIAAKDSPASAGGFFYIPYTAPSGGYYDYISVSDLYFGRTSPDFFSGKIVLIGAYAPGISDAYYTSLDRGVPTYGIEIHANIIDAYRKGFFPHEAGDLPQLTALFLMCFLMLLFLYDRKVLEGIATEFALCSIYLLLAYLLYRTGGIVLHVLWIPLFATVIFVMSVALSYGRSLKERKHIVNTFGHYVDPAIMKELLQKGEEGLKLGGNRKDIAVLFVDVRGFTSMSEGMEPEQVVEIINRYLTLTTKCIMKNHGTLDKFVGDCTMAFWNAPVPQEDPVYLACCAAFDMVKESVELGRELLEKYGRTVSFGIGVHYGPAVVGNIGAPERMDYTALGDTVNTASRLEANAPGGTILISRVVADMLGERAEVTSLGNSIKLKGKRDDFEILRLEKLLIKSSYSQTIK